MNYGKLSQADLVRLSLKKVCDKPDKYANNPIRK